MKPRKVISFRLPEEKIAALKRTASERGVDATELVEQGLDYILGTDATVDPLLVMEALTARAVDELGRCEPDRRKRAGKYIRQLAAAWNAGKVE